MLMFNILIKRKVFNMKRGDKVLIKEKYVGKEGVITNVICKWNCEKLYKVTIGNTTIKNWATDDCLELIVERKATAELYDTETEDIKQKKEYKVSEECYHCKYKYNIPGNAHIGCRKYCEGNTFASYGIANGWVINIPTLGISCFDPIWKDTKCPHFEEKE